MARQKPLLRRIAEEVYGEEFANKIWKRIEIIGDIAVIRVSFNVTPEELKPLAKAILEKIPYVKSVWAGLPGVKGEYRLREYVHLAGEKRSETIYKEHGCLFKTDITKVYISPRLNYEHKRIAKLVKPGEVVTNMFAGAGLFSIIIAKYSRPARVYSIDINPIAYKYMVENIKLNKVEDIVIPLLGDAAKVIDEKLVDTSDRVLMPLPELAIDYLPYAIKALRGRKGFIHVYVHVKTLPGESYIEKAKDLVLKRLDEINVSGRVLFARKVRMVGPRKYQVVLDLLIE
ncbi:class I SAM-dependent methyltransferase family protein [Desulfurococcaceae archaeon MEX13E-LK6-19]|nr:class I SAM-dependent methyltransferase family protein [Desulfurococcaceae archaeon MEX13E-LK6-19]